MQWGSALVRRCVSLIRIRDNSFRGRRVPLFEEQVLDVPQQVSLRACRSIFLLGGKILSYRRIRNGIIVPLLPRFEERVNRFVGRLLRSLIVEIDRDRGK